MTSGDDLVERLERKRQQLREYIASIDPTVGELRRYALTIAEGRLLQIDMDIVEAQEAAREITRLREAVKPFADAANAQPEEATDEWGIDADDLTVGDLRRAHSALETK